MRHRVLEITAVRDFLSKISAVIIVFQDLQVLSEVVASVSPYEVPVGCPVYKVQMCYRRPEFRKPLLEGLAGNAHSCCVYIDPQIRAADIVDQSPYVFDPNAQVSLLRTQALHGDGDAVFSREIAEYAIHLH